MDKRVLVAGAAFLALAPSFAVAQGSRSLQQGADAAYDNFRRDRNVSVRQRQHPGYQALGLRSGAFLVWPKVTGSVERNDNIFATDVNEQSDTVIRIAPEMAITSDWSRHALSAYARAVVNRYADFSTEDTEDYSIGANTRVDVLRTAHLGAGLDWSRLTEPRTSATAEGQARPVQYEVTTANLTAARELNRLRLSGRLDLRNYIYLAARGNSPQDDRDRLMTTVTGRTDYAVSPDTALFLQGAINKRSYRKEQPPAVSFPNFVDRDSDGFEVMGGANFEVSALARGEIGVGYMKQDYQNPRFDKISGLSARAQLEWFPTQLVTATFTGARSIEDAGIPGSAGYVSSNLGAVVDYELLRNVIVSGNANWGKDDYRGIDRTEKRAGAGVSATYLMNHNLGLTVSYNYAKQKSNGAQSGNDYTVNRIGASLTLQY